VNADVDELLCDSFRFVKALFFSPFSNVWEHSYPVSLVAESLHSHGIEIVTVNCDGMYQDFCIAMSAAGLTAESPRSKKLQVCAACRKRRNLLDKEFPFTQANIDSYVNSSDREIAQAIVSETTLSNWTEVEIRGIPIGRYSAYEFLLNYKILGTNIPERLFSVYIDQLYSSICTLLASEKILDEFAPDAVLTYNRLYAVNHAFLAVAEQRGIPTYSLQGGGHVTNHSESLTLYRDSQNLFQVLGSTNWADSAGVPINLPESELVASHLVGLLQASSAFAYSSGFAAVGPVELRAKLQIPENSPVLLIPMSSEDELNAAELADFLPDRSGRPNVFPDQFTWIRHVFSFAATHPELAFVLRLHPRMFPNKREGILAPVVVQVEELIKEAPSNIHINYPTDEISLYDLLQIVDVVLGYRSTVGLEAAAFGIPVVAPANKDFFTYPDTIGKTALSVKDFDASILSALQSGWSIENVRAAYRWMAYLFSKVAVDLSGSVKSKPVAIRPKKPGLKLWLWKKMVFFIIQFGPLVRERLSLRKKAFPQSVQDIFVDVIGNFRNNLTETNISRSQPGSLESETEALSAQLRFFSSEYWSNIEEAHSLAGHVRDYLKER
jgi:hypothetical protein